jgi:thiamine-monophosphate kinase
VTATLDAIAVPLSAAARGMIAAEPGKLARVLGGGDDYEVLCGVAPNQLDRFLAAAQRAGIAVTVIGSAEAGTGAPRWRDADRRDIPLSGLSYSHF